MNPEPAFATRLIAWQRRYGRHDLPWQHDRTAYRIWLSEIMLQQTQVSTVIPYFERFVARFPSLDALAAASEDTVLALWSGLGYYSRARNLLAAARQVCERYGGVFPATQEALTSLPGIGRSTAAAIAAQAYDVRAAILDGNVKRVLARHAGITGWPGTRSVELALWHEAEARLPEAQCAAYTQAIMDLGALVCSRSQPACGRCPVATDCVAQARALQNELPSPRPRKALPTRQTRMLLLFDRAGDVLLEKRPASGVWGGLYSLPELVPEADPLQWCRGLWGAGVATGRALPPLTHGFTHFRLQILPYRLALDLRQPAAGDRRWFSPSAARAAGLPAPVRRLLEDPVDGEVSGQCACMV